MSKSSIVETFSSTVSYLVRAYRSAADSNGHPQTTLKETASSDSSEVVFRRVALITGRPYYWGASIADAPEHAEGVGKLLEWGVGLPGASMGISAHGIGLIVRSIYAARGKEPAPFVNDWLNGVGATAMEAPLWHEDVERFGRHLHRLLRFVRQAETPDDFVWVKPSDANWWIATAIESLRAYTTLLRRDEDVELLLSLCDRHSCTLFAPFVNSILLEQLKSLYGNERYQGLLEKYHDLPQAVHQHRNDIYWSLRLLNFSYSGSRLVNIPILSLWSDRPSSLSWAPPNPEARRKTTHFSPEVAAALFEEALLPRLEVLFATLHQAFNIGRDRVEVGERESRPSVLYFAEPADLPARAEDYLDRNKQAIDPLVKTCLWSDDALSEQVAWGLLQRNLTTLRREYSDKTNYSSWYLLLPLGPEAASPQDFRHNIEANLWYLARRLSYLEFAFSDEASDIYSKMELIDARIPSWRNILEELQDLTTGFTKFLTLGRSNRIQVYEELEKIHVLQLRLQTKLENEISIANLEQQRFEDYVSSTKRYIRDKVTLSKPSHVSTQSLYEALCNPFPYDYLYQEFQRFGKQMSFLKSSIERIRTLSDTVNTVLENANQRASKRLETRTSTLSILVGFLALIGLAEFIPGAQLQSTSENPDPVYLGLLHLSTLEATARILIIVVGLAALGIFVLYWLLWVWDRTARRQKLFSARVQELWAYAEEAKANCVWGHIQQALRSEDREEINKLLQDHRITVQDILRQPEVMKSAGDEVWNEVERIDDQAAQSLAEICKVLNKARYGQTSRLKIPDFLRSFQSGQAENWLEHARYARYRFDLFALSPDIIPLPRTLCIFWYMSNEFLEHPIFSDQEFSKSLKVAGFKKDELDQLRDWLSSLDNQKYISETGISKLAAELKNRGVTTDPRLSNRSPGVREGSLSGAI